MVYALGYEEAFDPTVKIAFIVGQALFILTLILLVQVLFLSFLRSASEKRQEKFINKWQPILAQCISAVPESLPKIKKRDIYTFLVLWNSLQESIKGDYRNKLNELLKMTGLLEVAVAMLNSGSRKKQLTGIVTLGHLGEKSVWEDLCTLAEGQDSHVSLLAARALMHCSPEEGASFLMPLIASRIDWPPTKVANILKEGGAAIISPPLISALEKTEEENLPRLTRYLEIASTRLAIPALRKVLAQTDDAEVIAACLKLLNDPLSLEIIRDFLHHEKWFVRLQAASALGRIGTGEDEKLLIPLLSDKEWWVRYRAAHALVQLPSVSHERLVEICAGQSDLYAIDIMKQVVSENG
jgi:hypothetical protein